MNRNLAATLSLALCLPGLALADPGAGARCKESMLTGQYVFSASGFTRPAASVPGTPWVPKAIVEVLRFHGDGTLATPALALANPFADSGAIVDPPAGGAAGLYSIKDDCTGTLQFLDASSATFKIIVDPPSGNTIWMIQTNPPNNVIQGSAKRVW